MTEHNHAHGSRAPGDDVAAYALGALDPEEAEAFRAHLQTCVVCRKELAEFQAVADALPLTAPQYSAPNELRRRVLDGVAGEPRSAATTPVRQRAPRSSQRKFISRPALGLALGLILVLVFIGGLELGSSGSPRTHLYSAQVTGAGSAQIRLSGAGAKLTVRHFPAPPRGHIYEVWLQRSGRPPAPTDALFSVSSKGSGDVDVPGDLRGVSKVLVTPEPDGGSPKPTHAPVISVSLG